MFIYGQIWGLAWSLDHTFEDHDPQKIQLSTTDVPACYEMYVMLVLD